MKRTIIYILEGLSDLGIRRYKWGRRWMGGEFYLIKAPWYHKPFWSTYDFSCSEVDILKTETYP